MTAHIITSRGTDNPFVFHRALMIEKDGRPFVLHNTRKRGPHIQPLAEYLRAGRVILSTQPTQLDANQVEKAHQALQGVDYCAISFNCEHYVNLLTDDRPHSPQISFWLKALGVAVIIAAAIAWLRR